ncbi:hypothetical protein SY83_22285 [Paenibacillus swuensis]|uniref:RNA 2',3'-cyclic phosphodiesterase n=1 Tax=Paenibacillus swuensis TaxID=1178515 RepID=A0A172TNG3_9BACL|nr:RNA 2',3'-cyclic phosphodiesterase [Paenibacillus swuensis]ANE48560.1 hypothetical protein SY83_22285 [Paenibacillus swuensis]
MFVTTTKEPGETLRIFFAIPLPGSIKESLYNMTLQWQERTPFQRLSHPEDYHITLKFIGETSMRMAETLMKIGGEVAQRHKPFTLFAHGAGAFGKPLRPSVLWTGVTGDVDALRKLESDLVERISTIGIPKEDRPYRPHITLARNYKGDPASLGPELWSRLGKDVPPDATWTADRVVLYRTRSGHKPMYEEMKSFPLQP